MSHRNLEYRLRAGGIAIALLLSVMACSEGTPDGDLVDFSVPPGASLAQVTDTLVARDLVGYPRLFRAYARFRGDDRGIRAGRYRVPADVGWSPLLDQLVAGRMLTVPLTIPEGYTLPQIAPRLADVTEMNVEDVRAILTQPDVDAAWGVPGPGLEGYLFPDTYLFVRGISIDTALRTMLGQYQAFWTADRRSRAEALGMTEGEVTTLASIIQAEARRADEMTTISGVFHNRLRIGYLLQADATVQYALGERRSRLLYSDIDSVAAHPYNTYTQAGLPPGPIGAPGAAALDAALNPAEVDYLYFVARPDGSHIFTRTLEQHNRARIEARREWDASGRPSNSGG